MVCGLLLEELQQVDASSGAGGDQLRLGLSVETGGVDRGGRAVRDAVGDGVVRAGDGVADALGAEERGERGLVARDRDLEEALVGEADVLLLVQDLDRARRRAVAEGDVRLAGVDRPLRAEQHAGTLYGEAVRALEGGTDRQVERGVDRLRRRRAHGQEDVVRSLVAEVLDGVVHLAVVGEQLEGVAGLLHVVHDAGAAAVVDAAEQRATVRGGVHLALERRLVVDRAGGRVGVTDPAEVLDVVDASHREQPTEVVVVDRPLLRTGKDAGAVAERLELLVVDVEVVRADDLLGPDVQQPNAAGPTVVGALGDGECAGYRLVDGGGLVAVAGAAGNGAARQRSGDEDGRRMARTEHGCSLS